MVYGWLWMVYGWFINGVSIYMCIYIRLQHKTNPKWKIWESHAEITQIFQESSHPRHSAASCWVWSIPPATTRSAPGHPTAARKKFMGKRIVIVPLETIQWCVYIYNDALNWKISYSIPKQQASNFEPSCFIYPSLSEITAGHTQRSCYTVGSPYSRITKTLIEWIISLGFIKSLEAKFHDLIWFL